MEKRPYNPPEVESFKISPELKGRGVFLDTHETRKESGEISHFVFKEFHLDLLFSQKSAVDLFSKQEEEYETLRKYLPENMLARSIFLVPREMESIFELAKLDTENIYPYHKFWQIQANRRLAGRYGLDGKQKERSQNPLNQVVAFLGKIISQFKRKRFTGAIIQERINGISFADFFKLPNWREEPAFEKLRENIKNLIFGLRQFHTTEKGAAFTWHSLDSDNVMLEVDEAGTINGRVVVVDTNYSQRPDKIYQQAVIKKLEDGILRPLEGKLDLNN